MDIGFHTNAFDSSYWSFEQSLNWARERGLGFIECCSLDGGSRIYGLEYQPRVALWGDPLPLRRKMARLGIQFSQVDIEFPLSRPEGVTLGVEYLLRALRWAHLAGCPRIGTTDDRIKPAGMTERECLDHMRQIYRDIVKVAELYKIVINIEPYGYFTTKPEFMAEMLSFAESPFLGMSMDTGNTLTAGQDPAAFLEQFRDRVSHVRIKDVEGVNADTILKCVDMLVRDGYNGVLSLECQGQGEARLEQRLAWVRGLLKRSQAASA